MDIRRAVVVAAVAGVLAVAGDARADTVLIQMDTTSASPGSGPGASLTGLSHPMSFTAMVTVDLSVDGTQAVSALSVTLDGLLFDDVLGTLPTPTATVTSGAVTALDLRVQASTFQIVQFVGDGTWSLLGDDGNPSTSDAFAIGTYSVQAGGRAPEPHALLLTGAALAGLGLRRRAKRR